MWHLWGLAKVAKIATNINCLFCFILLRNICLISCISNHSLPSGWVICKFPNGARGRCSRTGKIQVFECRFSRQSGFIYLKNRATHSLPFISVSQCGFFLYLTFFVSLWLTFSLSLWIWIPLVRETTVWFGMFQSTRQHSASQTGKFLFKACTSPFSATLESPYLFDFESAT